LVALQKSILIEAQPKGQVTVNHSNLPKNSLENLIKMAILEVDSLRSKYTFTGPEILKGISFEVEEDDFFAIIGPSGAGKSTLIRCINRLIEPSSGSIKLHGTDMLSLKAGELRRMRRHIGMIFQEFNLIDRMSVMDNVLSGRLGYVGPIRSIFRVFKNKDIQRALELLERVGLKDHIDKRADQLSGGQRQRVGIARALMQEPNLLLLDEPTSALDPKISREVMGLIRTMATELKVPVLCNIHDVQLAKEFCNKIIGLQDGVKMFDGPTETLDQSNLDEIYSMEVL
jgi:phosphonate transport system ATP-binding protein